MASSKYPPFDRVTAGKLAVGDEVLIRERSADQVAFDNHLPNGIYEIAAVASELRQGWKRSSRYYTLQMIHAGLGTDHEVTVSSVQRFNRVTA